MESLAILIAAETTSDQPAWWQLLIAGATGGLAVKLLDVLYLEIKHRTAEKTTVEAFVQTQMDPILKAADELVGKIYSLAKEDFASIPSSFSVEEKSHSNVELANIVYLFSQFWASIEILRRDSVYVRLADSPSGSKLTRFLRCVESRRVRVLVRAHQRAVGESLIVEERNKLRAMGFSEFTSALSSNTDLFQWVQPLMDVIVSARHGSRTQQKSKRQLFLQYALVLHALIDTLDSDHTTTRDRPAQTSKLSPDTQTALRFRVFSVYLTFVQTPDKYWT